MAKNDQPPSDQPPAPDLTALQAENAELRQAVAVLTAKIEQMEINRPPSKSERDKIREREAAEKRAAMAKRDEQAREKVIIQKFNRDGDIIRERECARADVSAFERQGYKVKQA